MHAFVVILAKPEWCLSPLDTFAPFPIFPIRPLDSRPPPACPCAHLHFHTHPTFPTACLGLIQLTRHLALQWRCLETSGFQPGRFPPQPPPIPSRKKITVAPLHDFVSLPLLYLLDPLQDIRIVYLNQEKKNCFINALVKIKLPCVLQETGT